MDRDNLSSLSECTEYGKGLRVAKHKKHFSDTDSTDAESKSSEEELSITFPTYRPDKRAKTVSKNVTHKGDT